MVTRPTPPTVPPAPSRADPATFSALADAFLPIFALFQIYLEGGLDYDEELRDQALAAALGGDLPPLTGKALQLLRVNAGETAAEFSQQLSLFQGADVASADELLVLTDGNIFNITGGTTVASIETTADAVPIDTVILCKSISSFTLTHHATNLILLGSDDITTAAGDWFGLQKYASGDWRMISYTKADGKSFTLPSFENQLLHVRDEKAVLIAGGSSVATTETARVLNTIVTNEISGASLSSNQITLPAGDYFIMAKSPYFDCNGVKTWLENVTDTSTEVDGSMTYSYSASTMQDVSFITGRFSIAGEKDFEIKYYGQTAKATDGLGFGSVFETSIFTDVQIWKVA